MIKPVTNIQTLRNRTVLCKKRVVRCTNDRHTYYVTTVPGLTWDAVGKIIRDWHRMGYELISDRDTKIGWFLTFSMYKDIRDEHL